jgi:hypothetical protein
VPDTWVFEQGGDVAFHDWLDEHPDGYFLNLRPVTEARESPMIHAAKCSHFSREADVEWTTNRKVCGETQLILELWAGIELGSREISRCDCLR